MYKVISFDEYNLAIDRDEQHAKESPSSAYRLIRTYKFEINENIARYKLHSIIF